LPINPWAIAWQDPPFRLQFRLVRVVTLHCSSFLVCLIGWLLLGAAISGAQDQGALAIQEALIWTGYYHGPLDGELGLGTLNAIRRFQARLNQPGTGILTELQWINLSSQAAKARLDAGFSQIIDPETGIGIGIPKAFIQSKRAAAYGSDYNSTSGDVLIAVRRYRIEDNPVTDFSSLLQTLSSSKVEYKVQRDSWFVIGGSAADKKYYVRFHWQEGAFSGFYSIYDQRIADRFAAPLSMISFTLAPFAAAPHLNASAPLSSLPLEAPFSALLSTAEGHAPEEVAKGTIQKPPTPEKGPPTAQPDDPITSALLLDSVQTLLSKSASKNVRFLRYKVDKSRLKGFRSDMPVLRVVFEERVFFDTDKSDVRAEAVPVLGSVAETLRAQTGSVALFVAGHTDSRGSDEYNLALSIKRADSVARALGDRGVGSAAIWRVGFGKAVPLRSETSSQDMAYNRRVEFLIATQPAIIAAWVNGTKTLCEGKDAGCGGPSLPTPLEAVPVTGGLKPIPVEVPARPTLVAPASKPTARPVLPDIVPERPPLSELTAPQN
jgi:outer membrane protein OmpA-like peptidoglycan-associated protein